MSFTCKICKNEFALKFCRRFNSQCKFTNKLLERYQCPNCGVILGTLEMINNPTDKMLIGHDNIYNNIYNNNPDFLEDFNNAKISELKTFLSLEPDRNKIYLDYGFGRSSLLIDKLNDAGFNVYGYDAFTDTIGSKTTNDKSFFKNIKFDGIFSHNVLEHFQNPIDEFLFMNGLLKSNGKMAHATPCYKYLYEFTIFHLYFFVENSIDYLCKNSGFKIFKKMIDGEYINYIYIKA